MFNLIVVPSEKYWSDKGHGNTRYISLSRLFEYTAPEIESRLDDLEAEALSEIASLPTIFLTEVDFGPNDDPFVYAWVGGVSNLRIEEKRIYFDFNFRSNLGRIEFDGEGDIRKILGLGRIEEYRTHWAIKEGEVNDFLIFIARGDLIEGDGQAEVSLRKGCDDLPTVSSVVEFLAEVLDLEVRDGEELYYRGHSRVDYLLTPSIFRKGDDGDYLYLENEDRIVKEMLTAEPGEFDRDKYMIDKLVRMQHYELPTRLLDVTANPLVALYFSCSSERHLGRDGQVIIFRVNKDKVKFFNSDTISCISNLSMLSMGEKDQLDMGEDEEAFNKSDAGQKLLHHIKEEKPHFKDKIKPKDIGSIKFVKGRSSNKRISSQAGAFFVFGHGGAMREGGDDEFSIERVVVKDKAKVLRELDRMNINSRTIFPEMDKTAKEIAKKFKSS